MKSISNIYDDLYYKPGDTFVVKDLACLGHLTSSSTQIIWNITPAKRIDNINAISADNMKLTVRHSAGGYICNNIVAINSGTLQFNRATSNSIRCIFTLNTATGYTNNCPLSVNVNSATITFS